MDLFINPPLDEYRTDPRIEQALDGIRLLNLSEFTDWFEPQDRKSKRIEEVAVLAGKETEYRLRRERSNQEKQAITKDILQKLANTVCLDPKTGRLIIDEEYGKQAISRLGSNPNFDLLVAIDPTKISTGKSDTVLENKLKKVVGFIIAEFGECKRKPDVWSVNLICSKTNKAGFSIKGAILLGAFLYCIKNSHYIKEGILELAGGYKNINGFISYTKMGFNKDLSLYSRDCFSTLNNLPMSVNIEDLENETIINRAADIERRRVTEIEDDSGLYSSGRISDIDLQNLLITINNLLYKLEISFKLISSPDLVVLNTKFLTKDEKLLFSALQDVTADVEVMILNLKQDRADILNAIAATPSASDPLPSDVPSDISTSKGGKKYKKSHKKTYKKRGNKKLHRKRTRKNTYKK
jgi:hypothetical protein